MTFTSQRRYSNWSKMARSNDSQN